MPSSNVLYPPPLKRLNPWYPGQMGVPGAWTDTGIREHCTGTVFYVDPNFPGVSDARDGTDPTSPLQTVATALTRCQAYRGDVIAVMAANTNIYADPSLDYTTVISEEVEVNVPGVRIIGLMPSGSVGVQWNPTSDGGTCITIYANDVLVEGFCFGEGAYTGCNAIYAEYDGTDYFADYTTIRNCTFDDTVDIAIQLEYTWFCDIHSNVFWECDQYGIYVDPAGSGVQYCLLHHNRFHTCATSAITLAHADSDENHIFENAIYGAAGGTNNFINLTGGSGNLVDHNTFACSIAQYDVTCSDATSGAWVQNYCINGPTTANPV